nr:fibril-forming collagen alpha chain-like [Aegilops tauschii subsp. strangulata]
MASPVDNGEEAREPWPGHDHRPPLGLRRGGGSRRSRAATKCRGGGRLRGSRGETEARAPSTGRAASGGARAGTEGRGNRRGSEATVRGEATVSAGRRERGRGEARWRGATGVARWNSARPGRGLTAVSARVRAPLSEALAEVAGAREEEGMPGPHHGAVGSRQRGSWRGVGDDGDGEAGRRGRDEVEAASIQAAGSSGERGTPGRRRRGGSGEVAVAVAFRAAARRPGGAARRATGGVGGDPDPGGDRGSGGSGEEVSVPKVVDGQHADCGGAMVSKLPNTT